VISCPRDNLPAAIPTSLNNSQNALFTLTCPGSSTNSSERRLFFIARLRRIQFSLAE
jgi:hypothetical protein